MIRFRTIEPETAALLADRPFAPVAPIAAVADAPQIAAELPVRSKGLARKSPLRAKKPASAGLFRDEIG